MKNMIKKLMTILALALALPAAADVKSTSYLTSDVTSVADIEKTSKLVSNITWDDANKCAVFNGQASYIQIENPLKGTTLNTGFTIKMEAYISNENNSSGQYTARDGSKKNKNGWQRLFDLSDDTTSHYLFLNAGSSGHLKVAACYGTESWRQPTSTWYDNWHTYELIMAPGGYMTLYVDGNYLIYLANDDKVKSLMGMIDNLNICYLGTSIYEFRTTTNTDGFFFGKMRNVQFMNEPTRPAWDGSGFLYRLLYDSCGSTDPAATMVSKIPATLPSLTETGYTFGGWFKDKAYTQPVVTGETLTSNTTLYAKWEPALHSHCVCGDGECTVAGHTHKTLVWQPWTSTTTLPTTAGNYYLANDVTLSATYTPPTGVNLCLNGHVVNGNGACTLVKLNGGAAFTLTDCDKTTTHNFSVDANGLWTLTDTAKTVAYEDLTARPNAGDVVALTGGALTGGYINDYGTGGVWANGVFTMYGGNLVGNRNMAKHGGAIYIGQNNSYSVTLAGGHICGNSAAGCGGAIQQDGSCVSNLRLCGADVSFNAAGNKGGAVNSDSAVTVTGGRIAYNKAAGLGSAMSLTASSASVSMTGGSITHNESSESGSCGAVYFAGSSSYVVGGTLLLDENYTAGNERNLYLASGKTVSISTTTPLAEGAQIGVTTATAPVQGGYVAVTDATGAGLSKYFTSDNPAYTVMNVGNPVVLAIPSKVYVSKNGNDSNPGTVELPVKTLAAAYNKITSIGTIALLSDIDAPAGAVQALSVSDGKMITITSAKANGDLLDNAEGDYTGVYTIHRANNTSTMMYILNGNLTLKQVVVSGDAKSFTYAGSYGPGYLIFAPGNTADDTLSLGVNCILRDNINVGNNGGACGSGVCFGTEKNAHNPKMYMSANAAIIGCIAPRHGGAITMYDGDLYMSDNATMMYNGVEYQPAYSAYYGGGAILAYRGNVHMSGNATVTKNYVQLNGGSDSDRMHNSMQIDPDTASIGYVSGNARIFDNYDDGHLTRNADGSYTLVGTKQANAYAAAGKFYVDGAMSDSAKIGVTVKNAALNSVVANGTTAYAVTSADANKFFDDTETYKVMKHATNNQLIFGSTVVATTLTLDTLTTNSLAGTFGAAIGATANDITVFKDGVKMEGGYTLTVSGTSLSIDFDPALPEKVTIGVAVSKNGYKVNNGEVAYIGLHKHCLCGASGSAAHCAATHDETELDWKAWGKSDSLPTSAGNWYLVNDVTLTATYTPVDGVKLCLNGKVVKQTATASVMTKSSGTFTFTDCDAQGRGAFTGGKGTGTTGSQGGFVYLGGGTVNQYGGVLRGNSAGNCGGAVKIYAGTYNFYNGVMKDNVSASNGNAVQLDGTGTFNMYGGSIVSNRSSSAGNLMMGAIHIGRGTCNLLGGRITDNTGGGVSQFRSTNTVRLGGDIRITDNVNSNQACNLYLFNQTNPGLTIAVSTETPLTAGAKIGVTTATKPSTTAPLVPVTSNRGEDLAHFTSDEGHLVVNEAGKVQLKFVLNVAFYANHSDVTRDGAAFSSTNAVLNYGSTDGIPTLACGDLIFAGWTKTAGGTTPDYRTAEEVSTISTVSGSSHTLYAVWADKLVLGEFASLTQTFPDAVATADPGLTYKQVTLMFTREMTGETFVLPTGAQYSNYVKNTSLSTDYSCVIDLTTAQTAAEIATNYLRQVKFRGCVNQELRVVLGPKTGYKTFYFDETKHYYQYVPYTSAETASVRKWTDAYKTAKDMAFAGRQGYLATIANQDEDLFVYEASGGVIGWLGATSMNHGEKSGLYYASFTDTNSGAWYWACGPECGEQFFDCIIGDATSYARNAAKYYFNWRQSGSDYEPNNQPASGYGYAGERCLTTLPGRGCSTFGILGDKYSWNDIPVQNYTGVLEGYAAVGFIVEFGDKKIGDSSEPEEGEVASGVRGYAIAVADIVAPYVEFNAWGGYHGDDPTCEVASNVCVDGVYSFPRFAPTRAGEYTFDGWYESWTNCAAQAVEGNVMFVQGPHMLYAKWISPSTPAGEGTNTLAYASITNEAGEVVGDGAILVGATNTLLTTDFAVPEFTSNGADGKPYEIIAKKAFAYANYDRKVAAAERLTSVTISTYVTNIQEEAFRDCRLLSNLTFSATRDYRTGEKTRLVIDDWAFRGSTVKEIRFPADCTVDLKDGAFADTKNLTDIYLLGDVKVEAKYPFRGAGYGNYDAAGNQIPVNLHLSAKLAADPVFVLSLTNGMSAARIVLDQQIEGAVTITAGPTFAGDDVSFTFSVESDSPWLTVNVNTVYLFWSTMADPNTFIGNEPKSPKALVQNGDGSWTATFEKPAAAGADAMFFQLRIGADRLTETGMVINHKL